MSEATDVQALAQLNGADAPVAQALLADCYPGDGAVVRAALARRPFASLAALKAALVAQVRALPEAQQLAMVQAAAAAPDNAELTPAQAAQYEQRFGFAFVLAAGGARGNGLEPGELAATLSRRLERHRDVELAENLRQMHRIAELRLNRLLASSPTAGTQVWDWAQALAAHSDPGYAERGELTVTYLTAAHQACSRQLQQWMRDDCGFDQVSVDAVGNIVAIYHGQDDTDDAPARPRLLTGSHFDTVRNGGRYDGRLGILVPMACVQALHRAGRRLPFGIELVAFAEEEGQRYKAAFLGSGVLLGQFDSRWLDQEDADGITMRTAMLDAGLDPAAIAQCRRDPAAYRGFVEIHVEQGPILSAADLPLGVVTSINGGVRYVVEIAGLASHAGTTPMTVRRDAAMAMAELGLYLERRAAQTPDTVGTIGIIEVPGGSINVVPGRCRFTLDIRAATDPVRDACVQDVLDELARICTRRGVQVTLEETMRVAAAPCDPTLRAHWAQAVQALGLDAFEMPSGAGHDAMKLHEVMPQAMLFVRGGNDGISHNPLETITADDAQLAVQALEAFMASLVTDQP